MRCTMVLMSLALAAVGGSAYAKECRGVEFPDHVRIAGHELTLNGLGVRKATLFKVSVYVAALYVAKPAYEPDAILGSSDPVELTLHFVRSVDAGDLTNAWREGFARNPSVALPALQQRIATLNSWMTDVHTGQTMTFIRNPGTGIQVEVNGTVKGTLEGDDFAKAFLSIWFGPAPPNPDLKSGLLGGPCS
jgi:hypothetical protein